MGPECGAVHFFVSVPLAAPSSRSGMALGQPLVLQLHKLCLPSPPCSIYLRPSWGWQLAVRGRKLGLKRFQVEPQCCSPNCRRSSATERAICVQGPRMTVILGQGPRRPSRVPVPLGGHKCHHYVQIRLSHLEYANGSFPRSVLFSYCM